MGSTAARMRGPGRPGHGSWAAAPRRAPWSPGLPRPRAGAPPRALRVVGGAWRGEGRVAQQPGPVPGEHGARRGAPEESTRDRTGSVQMWIDGKLLLERLPHDPRQSVDIVGLL